MAEPVSIFILTEIPLTRRDYERFGIEILTRDFAVKVLDCTAWMNPKFWERYADIGHNCPERVTVADWVTFCGQLDKPKQAIVIDYLGDSSTALSVRKHLKKRGVPRVLVRCGLLPKIKGLGRFRSILRQGNFIMRAIRKVVRDARSIVRPELPQAEMAVVAGAAALNDRRVQRAEHIWVHGFDYDIYLRYRNEGREVETPYAVYLDGDLVFHPEYELYGEKPIVTAQCYYPAMNHFFDRLEYITGLKVIIAAHPRSRYDLRAELYAHRVPVLNRTCELVRDASLVMTTQSTAISYGVIYNKPIVYLNTDEYSNSDHVVFLHEYVSCLSSKIINVDHFSDEDIDINTLLKFSSKAYQHYMDTYIKYPDTPDVPIWEIFSVYIKKKFGLSSY